MKLVRTDQGRVIIGVLIALLIFLAAITPANCQAPSLASWSGPWLRLTGVLQEIRSVRPSARTAVVPGARLEIIF